jgi:hypothetical protein
MNYQCYLTKDYLLLYFHFLFSMEVGCCLQGTFFQEYAGFRRTTFILSPMFLSQDFWSLIFEGKEKGKRMLSCLIGKKF